MFGDDCAIARAFHLGFAPRASVTTLCRPFETMAQVLESLRAPLSVVEGYLGALDLHAASASHSPQLDNKQTCAISSAVQLVVEALSGHQQGEKSAPHDLLPQLVHAAHQLGATLSIMAGRNLPVAEDAAGTAAGAAGDMTPPCSSSEATMLVSIAEQLFGPAAGQCIDALEGMPNMLQTWLGVLEAAARASLLLQAAPATVGAPGGSDEAGQSCDVPCCVATVPSPSLAFLDRIKILLQTSTAAAVRVAALRLIGRLTDLLPSAASSSQSSGGGPTGSHPLVASTSAALLEICEAILSEVAAPPPWAYSQLGGVPETPAKAELREAAAAHQRTAAAGMSTLSFALQRLPLPALHGQDGPASQPLDHQHAAGGGLRLDPQQQKQQTQAPQDSRGASGGSSGGASSSSRSNVGKPSSCLIEELDADEAESEQQQLRYMALLYRLVLLCATFVPDSSLFSPWTCVAEGAGVAASFLLQAVADATCSSRGSSKGRPPKHDAKGSGSLMMLSAGEARVQGLLAAVLPELLPQLRRAIVAAQPHVELTSVSRGPAVPSGLCVVVPPLPTTFERAVAARSLACLVRSVKHPFIGPLVPVLLPAVLAVLDDPSAAVSGHGVWALHHLATEAMSADLAWQRDLLLAVSCRLVVGCDDELWPAVVPTTIATVQAIEGREPRSPGYHTLASELLTEAERNMHKRGRRLPMLRHFGALLQAMGLSSLRHMSRLMPLVLESLQAYDAPSRAAASDLLLTVVQCTWQRQQAHAPMLWGHLMSAFVRDAGEPLRRARAAAPTDMESQKAEGKRHGDAAGEAGSGVELAQDRGSLWTGTGEVTKPDGTYMQGLGERKAVVSRSSSSSRPDAALIAELLSGEGVADLPPERQVARNVLLVCRVLAACGGKALWDSVAGGLASEQDATGHARAEAQQLRAFMKGLYA